MVQPGADLLIEQQRQELILNAQQNGFTLPESITNPLGLPLFPGTTTPIPGIPGLENPVADPQQIPQVPVVPETGVPVPEVPVQ